MNPIYKPAGRAKEYGDYALNIYTGCPHGCTYCFAPSVLHKDRETFHSDVKPREGIVEATKAQLKRTGMKDKLIHLCFTCDPYPKGFDTTATREIIKAIKDSGNHVQILTKGGQAAERDIDLLDEQDWFGVTLSGGYVEREPNASRESERCGVLRKAKSLGIKTWVSLEPVFDPETVYMSIIARNYIDLYKIGKLNYHPSDINWGEFGHECERLCKLYGRNYYIKDDLRREMEVTK